MIRALLVLAALAVLAAAITLAERPPAERPPSPRPATPRARSPAARPTPAPPRLEHATINRQDRTTVRQRRRDAHAFDDRPLLARLPLELAGVTIDLAGLAADRRTVVLSVDPGARPRALALAVYRRALAANGDAGRGYELEWAR